MEQRIHIEDESGDRKYFTIIPNYILNHSTLYDREVYIQLKRYSGENGIAYPSKQSLAKKIGITRERLKKSIKYLLDHNWISFNGKIGLQTAGGIQFVDSYKINDLWKMNADYYESQKGGRNVLPLVSKGGRKTAQRVVATDDKEEHVKEEHTKFSYNYKKAKRTSDENDDS